MLAAAACPARSPTSLSPCNNQGFTSFGVFFLNSPFWLNFWVDMKDLFAPWWLHSLGGPCLVLVGRLGVTSVPSPAPVCPLVSSRSFPCPFGPGSGAPMLGAWAVAFPG